MIQNIATFLLLCFSLIALSQNTTICWDTSLSMQDRDINKDFEYLSTYFSENNTTAVNLILFKNGVTSKEVMAISPTNWDALKIKLSAIDYDGATSYQGLAAEISQGTTLLFTDGQPTIGSSNPVLNTKLIVVNSSPNYNIEILQLLSSMNNGTLVNLASKEPQTQVYSGRIVSENDGEEPRQ